MSQQGETGRHAAGGTGQARHLVEGAGRQMQLLVRALAARRAVVLIGVEPKRQRKHTDKAGSRPQEGAAHPVWLARLSVAPQRLATSCRLQWRQHDTVVPKRIKLKRSPQRILRGQESGVRSQESGVRSQESGVRGQESNVLPTAQD